MAQIVEKKVEIIVSVLAKDEGIDINDLVLIDEGMITQLEAVVEELVSNPKAIVEVKTV